MPAGFLAVHLGPSAADTTATATAGRDLRIGWRTRYVIGSALVLASATCGDRGTGNGGFEIETVGDVVYARNTGSGAWSVDAAWRLGTPVRIGADPMAEDPYAFSAIRGVTLGADGRVYVADGQAREIRVFSPEGEFMFRFGRSGEGPGEFKEVDGLARTPAGDILVRDPMLFRVTRFNPEGEYRSDFRIQRPYPQISNGTGFRVDRNEVTWDRVSIQRGVGSDDSLAVISYAGDGSLRDSVLAVQSPRRDIDVYKDGRLQASMPIPFAPSGVAAVGPGGTIARTDGAAMAFDLLAPDGKVRRTVSRDAAPASISAAERDSTLDRYRTLARELTGNGEMQDFEFPTRKSAITHLLADAAGNWWVGANNAATRNAPPDHFDVFDPEGRYLGAVSVAFRVYEIGDDYVAGVAVDELGVESVVVAPLIKPGP